MSVPDGRWYRPGAFSYKLLIAVSAFFAVLFILAAKVFMFTGERPPGTGAGGVSVFDAKSNESSGQKVKVSLPSSRAMTDSITLLRSANVNASLKYASKRKSVTKAESFAPPPGAAPPNSRVGITRLVENMMRGVKVK